MAPMSKRARWASGCAPTCHRLCRRTHRSIWGLHAALRARPGRCRTSGPRDDDPAVHTPFPLHVRSSQSEGTQSSLSDLLLFENDEAPTVSLDDVTEVSNYVAAINHGVSRMRGGFPLSLRLIGEMHAILLKSGRGARKQSGEFRHSQNWIGGTRPGNALFVPPPPDRLDECLGARRSRFAAPP